MWAPGPSGPAGGCAVSRWRSCATGTAAWPWGGGGGERAPPPPPRAPRPRRAVHEQPHRIIERPPARHAAPPPGTAPDATAEGDLPVAPPAHRTSRGRRTARRERHHRPTARGPLQAGMGKEPARHARDVRHPPRGTAPASTGTTSTHASNGSQTTKPPDTHFSL